MFFKVGICIIIILLLKVISNQQELDCHLMEISTEHKIKYDELINRRGIINKIIWKLKLFLNGIIYILKSKRLLNKKGSK